MPRLLALCTPRRVTCLAVFAAGSACLDHHTNDSSQSLNPTSTASSSQSDGQTSSSLPDVDSSADNESASSGCSDNLPVDHQSHELGFEPANLVREATPDFPNRLRFVAIGDTGTGGDGQKQVAKAIEKVCAQRGCDLVWLLGDNIYESGAISVDDPQFQDKFEVPYAKLDMPFYVVLGNHDYGGNGSGTEPEKSTFEIAYSTRSQKWTLPSRVYTLRQGPFHFFALDSNSALISGYNLGVPGPHAQEKWLDEALKKSDASWKIVLAHHPYVSSGSHGNAGDFDDAAHACGISGAMAGHAYKDLIEDTVCTQAHVMFAGHDHNREWALPRCGTEFMVSGAGAKLRDTNASHAQPTLWFDDLKLGFLWIEIDGSTLHGVFYDDQANIDFERTIVRPEAAR